MVILEGVIVQKGNMALDLCDMPLPLNLLKPSTKRNLQAAHAPGLGMSMSTGLSGVRCTSKGAFEVGMVKRVLPVQRTASLASDTTVDPEALDSSETDSLSGHSGGPGSCEGSEPNEVYGRRAPAPPDSLPEDFGYVAAMAAERNRPRHGKGALNNKKVFDERANGSKSFPKDNVPFDCSPEAFAAAWRDNSSTRNTFHQGAGAGRRVGTGMYMSPGPLPFSGKHSQKRFNKDDSCATSHPSAKFNTSAQPLPPGPLIRNKKNEPALDVDCAPRPAEPTLRNAHVDEKSGTPPKDTSDMGAHEKTQADATIVTIATESEAKGKGKKQNKESQAPLPPKRLPVPSDLAVQEQMPIPGMCDKPLKIYVPDLDHEQTSLHPAFPCKKRVPDWGF